MPTIKSIQRTTALLTIGFAALLLTISTATAVGCLLGGCLMIANLFALALIGRSIIAIAQQRGGVYTMGLLLAPLKMLMLAAIVYLIIHSGWVNVPGFIVGTLAQFVAIFVESWRSTIKPETNAGMLALNFRE